MEETEEIKSGGDDSMKNHMRGTLGFFLTICLLVLATACSGGSSYSVMNPRTFPLMDGMAMRYSKMNGKKAETIFAVRGTRPVLDVEVETVSGSIAIVVAKNNARDVVIDRYDNVQTSQFAITLPEPGEYYVWVEAKDHQGSFWIELRPSQ